MKVDPPAAEPWDKEKARNVLVLKDTLGESLQGMDEGLCDHMLVDLDMFTYELSLPGSEKHCDKGVIGGSVTPDLNVAYPIRLELEPIFSQWFRDNMGRYRRLLQEEIERLNLKCPPFIINRQAPAPDPASVQYGVKNFT
eukprot:CAMPEP_0118925036 /NCGR_PEP_ID=MMETSP1169-20130426/2975_1 /TAXON_ID=36882 /ORGANISM="Pyramimonas obovata, Strain CCMP722" /LENGTH=139 /DNA_ID=CAMNT_0006866227 /DNA_START=1 /DNA_END=417 /DNA_ORIENTATION=-